VDLSIWVGVGLGGNCDCSCGILYAPMSGKNIRKPLPCKYYLPTTLDTYKQRHTPQRFTHMLLRW